MESSGADQRRATTAPGRLTTMAVAGILLVNAGKGKGEETDA